MANLLQLYHYDFLVVRDYGLTPHGKLVHHFLDHLFVEPGRRTRFGRHDGQRAGFVSVRQLPDGAREVAELIVARTHRRQGVARRAAPLTLAGHPERGEVAFDTANAAASGFWPGVVDAVAGARLSRVRRAFPPRPRADRPALRHQLAASPNPRSG